MKGWVSRRIKDLTDKITKGTTPTTMGYAFTDVGINFIKAESISRTGNIDPSTSVKIDIKTHEALRRSQIHENDVLVTIAGIYLGKIGLVKKNHLPANTNQAVALIRSKKDELVAQFLKYYLLVPSTTVYLNSLCPQSAQPNLNLTQLGRIQILLPPLPIQRKIAAVLSAYDDLIENNKRRIALLEKMAEELYREWFVRLRFPGHESVKIVKGVPEGWEVKKIGKLGKVITGKTPPTTNKSFFGGEYPFIKTPDMHHHLFITNTEESLSENGINYQRSQTIPEMSICVSCIGTGGVVAISTKTSQTNQQINTLLLSNKINLEWAYFMLKGKKGIIELFGYTGSTMTNLSKGKFENLVYIYPNENVVDIFHTKSFSIFKGILSLNLINERLCTTRDRLLSRLMSGKIDLENLDIRFPASMREEEAHA